jgi:dolichyl-phosphate-mannose--protein O-mannosyl transferase
MRKGVLSSTFERWPWIALALGSFTLRFLYFGHPAEVVFDESLIGDFFARYFSGDFYLDVHPPHLKMLYAALAGMLGFEGTFPAFEQAYPGIYHLGPRAFVCLCGALSPLLVAKVSLQLGARRTLAFAAGWALALDGAHLAESRLILNDGVMLFFGLAGWASFGSWRARGSHSMMALSIFCLSVASSIKWTGLSFCAPILMLLAFEATAESVQRRRAAVQARKPSRRAKRAARRSGEIQGSAQPPAPTVLDGKLGRNLRYAVGLIAFMPAWHFAGYELHFRLLPNAGPGTSFMSPEFNARLKGSRESVSGIPPLGDIEAVIETQAKMAYFAARVGSHPYSSSWLGWPLGLRGIYFWHDRAAGDMSRIYMLPNLVVWWSVALGMAWLLAEQTLQWLRWALKRAGPAPSLKKLWIGASFLALWLPYAFIGRIMFLYHYLPALALGLCALAFYASELKHADRLAIGWVVACAAMFLWMAPLGYGLPLSAEAFDMRMLFPTWP